MRGKIEIVIPRSGTIRISGNIDDVDGVDVMMLFHSLAEALDLDDEDRFAVGVIVAAGGPEALGAPAGTTVRVASELIDAIEHLKNKPLD